MKKKKKAVSDDSKVVEKVTLSLSPDSFRKAPEKVIDNELFKKIDKEGMFVKMIREYMLEFEEQASHFASDTIGLYSGPQRLRELKKLKPEYSDVISEITEIAEFLRNDIDFKTNGYFNIGEALRGIQLLEAHLTYLLFSVKIENGALYDCYGDILHVQSSSERFQKTARGMKVLLDEFARRYRENSPIRIESNCTGIIAQKLIDAALEIPMNV